MASVNGLSSAFPENKVFQDEIKELGRKLFSSKIVFKKMEKVYRDRANNQRFLKNICLKKIEEENPRWNNRLKLVCGRFLIVKLRLS